MTKGTTLTGGIAVDLLLSLIERVEHLEEERTAITTEIKTIFTEAKHAGFDVKIMKQLINIRSCDQKEIDAYEELLTTYRRALRI
ncbi:DUF2312 domain-containing protein [Saccharibacter sp. 17.LH.SD]|uniref:DUF2312 domain-containing protein n=1 Tax=Saccharibacter sp. 17.LH.SD TaxID=2689393 RepID=UPI001368579F|nr:DUF2312 domain-containing protein [Saccharibacter sp. 17.LH.SD]MXV44351.1 DUF2312 domain-containing protein [Saccharibacter sp. 17.LH.SD]